MMSTLSSKSSSVHLTPIKARCFTPSVLGPTVTQNLRGQVQSCGLKGREVVAAMTITDARTIVELTADSFQSFVDTHPLVMVDYCTPWCGPCKAMAPLLVKMAQDFNGIAFARFDCGLHTRNKQHAIGAGIKALPTFHLYRGNEKVGEVVGAKVESLKEMLAKHL